MDAHAPDPRGTTLVIGYGNTLRGDDGVGPRIAAVVAGWARPGVEAIAVHQLGPELAVPLAEADRAFFVDARGAGASESYQVRPVGAGGVSSALGHASDPRALLALAAAAFGRHPEAWTVTVPATVLDLGEGLSPTATRAMAATLQYLSSAIRGPESSGEPGSGLGGSRP
jgi:hydrogenase maturation protease